MTPQAAPAPLKSETSRAGGAHSDPQPCARSNNGAQSRGPVTPEGKATSSMNALRHGLCSQQIVMPGEDQSAFDLLRQDYLNRLRPQGPAEIELVETLAASSWRLKRIIRLETALLSGESTDPCKAISLLMRYENQLNRSYTLAMQRLEALQQARAAASKSPALRNEPTPLSKSGAHSGFSALGAVQPTSQRDLHKAIQEALALPEPLTASQAPARTKV